MKVKLLIMLFNSYQKIAESPKDWQLEHPKQLDRVRWCATEKIHGANLCWIKSKDKLLAAKRKAILEKSESFFNYQAVRDELADKLTALFNLIEAETLYVYGELFGGHYPHPEVKALPNIQAVQTGVYYSPAILFCAFDIAIKDAETIHYLDYQTSIQFFESVGILYAKPRFIGSFREALEQPERFLTAIPQMLGLPELPNNFAEGLVIKPMQEILVKTTKQVVRPILKKKITEFAEDERFHAAEKWVQKPVYAETYVLDWLEYELSQLVNVNRLQSAVSKVGELKTHSLEIKKLVIEDVWESLKEHHAERLESLTTEDKELLDMLLNDLLDNLIKTHVELQGKVS
jgi:Rnl2 family RNA ligase